MKNIFLIARREFLTQVKKKSFIILTVLSPILMIVFGGLVGGLIIANKSQTTIQVIDKSGIYQKKLISNDDIKYIPVPIQNEKKYTQELKNSETINGILIIEPIHNQDYNTHEKNTKLLVNDKLSFNTKASIIDELTKIIREEKAKSMNLSTQQMDDLKKDFELKTTNINDNGKDTDLDFGVKYGLGIFLMYITFMFILMYGVRVMRSVLEEKNNRVVEIIISSVKPFHLMIGKIIGVTLVALTQFSVWISMTVIGAIILSKNIPNIQDTTAQTPPEYNKVQEIAANISNTLLDMNAPLIIAVFIFFFLFGYIFYSSMYAAIGSAVDNETETQQFSLFAIIPLMLGMYGSFSIVNNPDGPIGFWLSIIPFTSPVAMVARIPFGVPISELIISITILIISSIIMIFIASKIYRIGILMHGNKASIKDLWKWIKEN